MKNQVCSTCLGGYVAEESSVHSDSTVEADTNTDLIPGKQSNLTLELFPNHSESLESAKKVVLHFV